MYVCACFAANQKCQLCVSSHNVNILMPIILIDASNGANNFIILEKCKQITKILNWLKFGNNNNNILYFVFFYQNIIYALSFLVSTHRQPPLIPTESMVESEGEEDIYDDTAGAMYA